MTTTWQQQQLTRLAQRMVRLEQIAKRAEARYDQERAADAWERRAIVQWQRSLLLRDAWAQQHGNLHG